MEPSPLATPGPGPRRGRNWALLLLALVVLTAGFVYRQRQQAAQSQKLMVAGVTRTARVRTGALEKTLRVTGITAAGNSAMLLAPALIGNRSSGSTDFHMILEGLAQPGTRLKKGDLVAAFDRQYMLIRMDDYKAWLFQHETHLQLVKAGLEVRRRAQEQRIRVTKGRMDKAALDLKTVPVRSANAAERLRLALAEARARYEQAVRDAANISLSEQAQIRRTELDLRETQIEIRRAERNLSRMVVRSPIDGMAVMQSIRRGGETGQVQNGDQLHPGQPFVQIVDLNSMVLQASVNQVDAELLRVGAHARVQLDATPGLELPARLYSIGTFARAQGFRRDFVKDIPLSFKIETTDPRVLPNLSASADVVLGSEAEAAIVPLECVFTDPETSDPVAYAQGSSGWEKRKLELGLANNVAVTVHSGLREGEIVAAEPPR